MAGRKWVTNSSVSQVVPGRLQTELDSSALFDDFQVGVAFDSLSGCVIEHNAALDEMDAPLARAK
jgi:hypothetical protein